MPVASGLAASPAAASFTSDSDNEGPSSTTPRKPTPIDTVKNAASPAARSRTTSASSSAPRSASPGPGFFSSLKSRIVGPTVPSEGTTSDTEEALKAHAASVDPAANQTQEALEQPRADKIGAVDELLLIVHGIGQGLAASYDSFGLFLAPSRRRSPLTVSLCRFRLRCQHFPLRLHGSLDLGNPLSPPSRLEGAGHSRIVA